MRDEGAEKFGRSASIMVASVFLSKILGLLVVIPLQNLIGGYAYGIYRIAYPLYTIMLTLSTSGFPLALSKTIARLSVEGKHREASATFRTLGRFMLILGIASFFVMWFGAPTYLTISLPQHSKLLEAAAIPAIRALAPALLLFPIISLERGFLQGYQHMKESGSSQVIEQVIRVGFILSATIFAVVAGYAPATKAALATFGATAGAVVTFLFLRNAVRKLRKETRQKSRYSPSVHLASGQVLRHMFFYALPIATGTLVFPLSQAIDAWTVPRLLAASGASMVKAITDYGIYTGEALILMQLPLSFANAIGTSTLPAITEARAMENNSLTKVRLQDSLRMMAFISMPAAMTLSLLAGPINYMLFASNSGTEAIAIAGVMSIFSALELVSTYILQGYDHFYKPVVHMMMGAILKLVLNIILIPRYGINGAAIASTIGYLFSSWLNMRSIRQTTGNSVRFPIVAWRPLAAAVIVGLWFLLLIRGIHVLQQWQPEIAALRVISLIEVLIGLFVGAPIYLFFALLFKAVSGHELARLPIIGRFLVRIEHSR